MCADCHSTAVTKGFNATTNTFDTQFAEVSVGCEACHGPGGGAQRKALSVPVVSLRNPEVRLAVCGSCHSRRSQVAEGFVPASRCWITMSHRCWTRVYTLPMVRSWTRFLFTAPFCKAKCTMPVSVAATVMRRILASFSAEGMRSAPPVTVPLAARVFRV